MKEMFNVNKILLLVITVVVLIIACLLDIKYEGLFYQILPDAWQSSLLKLFN